MTTNQPGAQAIVLQLVAALPALHAEEGDRILIRLGHRHPIILQRSSIPGHGWARRRVSAAPTCWSMPSGS